MAQLSPDMFCEFPRENITLSKKLSHCDFDVVYGILLSQQNVFEVKIQD